ncbi:MAG: glycogen-binding domain-containing protein, partial [Candidatus Cloacimonetes bacterium]|nr:glycogen-binding domain-containing protein [Candidatus Cloacimonadota bacterium]
MRKVILFIMIFCWGSMAFAGVSTTKKGVEFFYEAPDAGKVCVAGEFNDWNTSAHVMKLGDDGVWRIVIPLSSGSYMYKFVVDDNWYADPDNPKQQDDGYGGVNSVILISNDELVESIKPSTVDIIKPPPKSRIAEDTKFKIPSTTSEVNIMVGSPSGTAMHKGIRFLYKAPDASQVSVAGDFNDWDTSKHIMSKNRDGIWEISVPLETGTYMYKFVVDGNWIADPDNPKQQDDGYGGVNSLVEVSPSGDLVVEKVVEQKQTGVRTFLNPKVLFDGRVYSKNIFEKEEYNDKLMLDKPLYDINLGVKIKFNSQVEGYTVMNINNTAEGVDMWKTHLNFKRSYLKLDTPYFLVHAFDKFGFLTFDDPLHLVGSIGNKNYNFGYDVMGVYGRSNLPMFKFPLAGIPMQFQAEAVFADNAGDDDTDINAYRGKALFDIIPETTSLRFGFGEYHAQLPQTSTSSKEHASSEFDMQLAYSLINTGWQGPMEFILSGEYYQFKDTNNENMDSLKTTFAKGDRIFAGLEVNFPAVLKIYAHFQRNKLEFARDITKSQLTLGGEFSTEKIYAKVAASSWKTDFPDSLVSWNDYYVYMEKTDGNGRWFQKYTNVPYAQYTLMGYETAMYWDILLGYNFELFHQKFHVGYEGKIAQQDIKYEPKLIENIASLQWDISPQWTLYTNLRVPIYNDP